MTMSSSHSNRPRLYPYFEPETERTHNRKKYLLTIWRKVDLAFRNGGPGVEFQTSDWQLAYQNRFVGFSEVKAETLGKYGRNLGRVQLSWGDDLRIRMYVIEIFSPSFSKFPQSAS